MFEKITADPAERNKSLGATVAALARVQGRCRMTPLWRGSAGAGHPHSGEAYGEDWTQ
jgi:hypothetical protein